MTITFEDKPKKYVAYEGMRNTNIPRQFGIPNPMAYQRLCKCIADNWTQIQQYFTDKTNNQTYKVSRIHIRKLMNSSHLFEMSYSNWRIDGSPEPDLIMGKRYLVNADIATCFPSIYTHSIPWALVGKEASKCNRGSGEWFNCIDHFSQQIKDGETHGLLIGPHASNLLSEIILTFIDYQLISQGWKFTRNIDDYSCYVSTFEEGQLFLLELSKQLKQFDLLLNHKKTEIHELPIASVAQWVRQINAINSAPANGIVNYKIARAYIDSAIELMQCHNNAAILNYALQVLSHKTLTENARDYCTKTFFSLALLYPYLVPLLEEHLIKPFAVQPSMIEVYAELLYIESNKQQNLEGIVFSIYYALKWGFKLNSLNLDSIIDSRDCLTSLLAYKYFEKHSDKDAMRKLKEQAKLLKVSDMDAFWLFVYETLPKSDLSGAWKPMKENGISFIRI